MKWTLLVQVKTKNIYLESMALVASIEIMASLGGSGPTFGPHLTESRVAGISQKEQ